jgi:hypothetical protein
VATKPRGKTNKLKQLLLELSRDPKKWAAFEDDPDGVMAAAGISKAHQAALKSRNVARIRKALQAGPRAFMLLLLRLK